MTLAEYLKTTKRGEMARLRRESGLDYSTVWQIARRGYRLTDYRKAKRLSEATGGKVSVEELCAAAEGVAAEGAGATGTEG